MPARWPISRTPRRQAGLADHTDRHRGHRACATTAASSISTTARSNSRSSSIPGNGCFTTRSARSSQNAPTRWIEPPWKAILSNKGILPLLWEMFPEPSQSAAGLFRGRSERGQARRSLRAQAALFARRRQCRAGQRRHHAGRAGRPVRRGRIYPPGAWRRCRIFPINTPVLGSWLVDHTPCGLSIREDENPITGNTSRFVPHAIL